MKKNDKTILIKSSAPFNQNDFVLTTLLYGPLLDSDSLKLYFTLISLSSKETLNSSFTETNLIDVLGFSYNKYLTCRSKLEALDLLLTYQNDSNYLLMLHKPASAKQFLKDGILGMYLNNKIGEDNLRKVINVFKTDSIDLSQYTNISKSFDEVYSDIDVNKQIDIKDELEVDIVAKNVNKKESNFDFDEFAKNVNLSFIPLNKLDEFKQKIVNDAYMYSLDVCDLIVAYNKACSYGSFNLNVYKEYIKKVYNETHNKKVLTTKKVNNDELYNDLANLSIDDLFSYVGLESSASNIAKVSEIYSTIDLDRSSINLIILAIAKEKKELPSVNYFVSIYNTLSEKNILSFNDIKEYFYNQGSKNNKQKKKPTTNTNADWVDKNMEDFLGGLTNE